jgi:hypothetical protein
MKIALSLLALWIAFMAFMWFKGGLGKGRKFGNEIARHLDIPGNLFHSLLESGVSGPSLQLLAMLQGANMSLERASVELGPSLHRGAVTLEAKFGPQEAINRAKPVISKLVREWEALQVERNE